jgi:hypothetical protein
MKSDIFPSLKDSKTLSLIEVYIEELLLWKEVKKIAIQYPNAHFNDIFPFSYWQEFEAKTPIDAYPQFSKLAGENEIQLHTPNYTKEDISPIFDLMGNYQGFIRICPSHFLSGALWRKYSEKHDKIKLLVIDAHDDRGGLVIDSLWIQSQMVQQTAFIGGWGMKITNGKDWMKRNEEQLTDYGVFTETIRDAIQSPSFRNFIRDSRILISIDLDFFDNGPYLSSYWLRNLFLTHSLSVRQKIELLLTKRKLNMREGISIGKIALGSNLLKIHTNKREKMPVFNSIFSSFCKDMKKILNCCLEENTTIIGIDLCEYSPILDKNAETFQLIGKMADFLYNYIENEI